MNPHTLAFNFSEEAFVLSNLHEVVKVWARGSGQATFELKVDNGVADLTLGFRLGHPADPHCFPNTSSPLCTPQLRPQQHQQSEGQGQQYCRRKKGPKRRERDRLRAELYQQKNKKNIAASAVILPISGTYLPVRRKNLQANSLLSGQCTY